MELLYFVWLRFGRSGEEEDCAPYNFGGVTCHDCYVEDPGCAKHGVCSVHVR